MTIRYSSLEQAPAQKSLPPRGGGKEELRASILKPYLLRLRALHDDAAMRGLLVRAGIPSSVIDDETAWISVATACRALRALEVALGDGSLASRGEFITHPENLGTYVRLLRSATQPLDAYRFLTDNSLQTTRVGSYEMTELGPSRARLVYRPRLGEDTVQDDRLLCDARKGELASMPRLWGAGDARIVHEACLAKGDPTCSYVVHWHTQGKKITAPVTSASLALVSAAAVSFTGNWPAIAIAGIMGAGLGGTIGTLCERVKRERRARVFDRNRITALERGLELRGESQATASDLSGALLGGKYRIVSKIGSGGIGVVYAAEHVALGSQVAVKVLRGAAAKDGSEIARLRREAQVQCSIEHPNVVRTLDLDQMPDGSIYVVMELLRGRSLAEKLARGGPVAPGFAVPMFIQVCRALRAAHDKGVIHRDLKPGNIFLCDDGTAKVLDFGMSKFAAAESLTQEGYTLGTPEYMAPEQCIGAPVEPRSDLYSFGVLMYEALIGELPILAKSRRDLLELHQRHIPIPMRERRPDLDVPEQLDRAVMTALRKRIDERPRSALELEAMLSAISLHQLPRSYPPGVGRPPSRTSGARARRAS